MGRIERAAIAVAVINTISTLFGHPTAFAQESDPNDRTQYPYSEKGNIRIWEFPDRAGTRISVDNTCTFGFLNVTWERNSLEEGEEDSLTIFTDGIYNGGYVPQFTEMRMNAARDFNATVRRGNILPGESTAVLDRYRRSGFGPMTFLDAENIFCAEEL